MLYVQSTIDHPRLRYVLDFVLNERLGLEYEIVSESSETQVLRYAAGGDIVPSVDIWNDSLHSIPVSFGTWNSSKALFPNGGEIPFDVFAAIFWLLSRYEEYGVKSDDPHDRFTAEMSALSPELIEQPLIDQWVAQLGEWIEEKFSLTVQKSDFKWRPTIDVDSAYAFLGKGVYRTLGGFAKDLRHGELVNMGQRFHSLIGRKGDPYNTYNRLHQLHDEAGVTATFFFLLGDFGTFDRGLPHDSNLLQDLILETQTRATVALHPSVAQHDTNEGLKKEMDRLRKITQSEVDRSRFHYLKFSLPDSYRALIKAGMAHDHTMGYQDQIGFRAGTSHPFRWFDLSSNKPTELTVHPFSVMEATLKNYMNLTPEQGVARVKELRERVEAIGGILCTLWHNESLSGYGEWEGWGEVYEACFGG